MASQKHNQLYSYLVSEGFEIIPCRHLTKLGYGFIKFLNVTACIRHVWEHCGLYTANLPVIWTAVEKLSFLKHPGKANTKQQISTMCHFSLKLAALCIFRKVIFPSSSILTKWWWQTNNEPISSEGNTGNNFIFFFPKEQRPNEEMTKTTENHIYQCQYWTKVCLVFRNRYY